jgi:hypothetical protein
MTGAMPPPRRDIFTEFPSHSYDGALIVRRYPEWDDRALGWFFAEAADRLAASHRGAPVDDTLLLPFLYLYRHAMELELKRAIRFAARLRRNNGETDSTLSAQAVNERLKIKHRHSLMALVDELDRHFRALGEPPFPAEGRRMFTLIAASDRRGEAFRYPGRLPDGQDYIDFPKLAAALKQTYRTAETALDGLSAYEQDQYEMLADQYTLEAEYSEDIGEELQNWD